MKRRIKTVDAHAEGEPLRIIVEGWPEPEGETMLAKRAYARAHHDELRRSLMWEPRGHADMYGALPVAAPSADGDIGVLFMHNEGWSTMCGHGIIALVKAGLEHGLFAPRDEARIRIDTPAGRVLAAAQRERDRIESVSFVNVPSFVDREFELELEGFGRVAVSVAFGGAYYAYVDADALGLELAPRCVSHLLDADRAVRRAVEAAHALRHPSGQRELDFLYGVIFVSTTQVADASSHSRNVCVFAAGEVDRSPTGTGVSGRVAIEHHAGRLAVGEWIRIESILGTSFDVRVLETTSLQLLPCSAAHAPSDVATDALDDAGPIPREIAAVVPEVRGRAFVTGQHDFVIDPEDPLSAGFLLR